MLNEGCASHTPGASRKSLMRPFGVEKKATLTRGFLYEMLLCLNRSFVNQFVQVEIFLDFPAFIAMFQGLLGLIIQFSEGMFGIANSFTDDFQRFGHSLISFVQV